MGEENFRQRESVKTPRWEGGWNFGDDEIEEEEKTEEEYLCKNLQNRRLNLSLILR